MLLTGSFTGRGCKAVLRVGFEPECIHFDMVEVLLEHQVRKRDVRNSGVQYKDPSSLPILDSRILAINFNLQHFKPLIINTTSYLSPFPILLDTKKGLRWKW